MKKMILYRLLQLVGATLLSAAPLVCNAQVYKCVENGSTTFQGEPCKNGGSQMHLDAGPSAQAVEEARLLADKNKKAAADSTNDWRTKQKNAAALKGADCGQMNQRVASLQATGKQYNRDAIMDNGNPVILNKLSAANQRQTGDAQNLAQAFGCQ